MSHTHFPDFWPDCGAALAGRDDAGRPTFSAALMRIWWQRPEAAPVPESGPAERALHAALLDDPLRPVSDAELAAIGDADAIENYGWLLALRARLQASANLEAAYLELFRGEVDVPPVFVRQITQIILRVMLDGCDDAQRVRAAELFFRPQKASLQDGAVLLADAATVAMHESGGSYGDLGRLLAEARIRARRVELEVLEADNAQRYWQRSDRHDLVLNFSWGSAGQAAFCRLMEAWIARFFDIGVTVTPLAKIEEPNWAWHIGLDAQASAILNDLWRGASLEAERQRRILALFRMDVADASLLLPSVASRPIYLAAAMDEDGQLRIKPQNLLVNLPLARLA
ncbi:DUF6352 family protein [Noviherbaspirillum pedocola]|uniref:Uncharacterized protein n=1 Tax=Noviherbaspirillum pedocola TaxID=2801341 RepID=A0A934SWI6_9BURK|nr:DUF6352 family protein [Noviherbaspirillum pedocola]MBK4733148.1 hypothetical protein [Noviherbaspirillum pedocola]